MKKELGAEVLYLQGSPDGTVIKVSIREPIPLTDFLAGMAEVAEAWEETAPHSDNREPFQGIGSQQPANPSREPDKVVCVALKPTDHSLVWTFNDALTILLQQDTRRVAAAG